ncbi:Hypothetical predicted protein [Cloeon dipterum]|uniref:Uncharacterized protein n=1 Tax=Cloeon dipterum TaxID=197152 RepID=A0A8S1E7V3_9INSE|nr:Hypothetical predicted protein [Cloeon dipterum]
MANKQMQAAGSSVKNEPLDPSEAALVEKFKEAAKESIAKSNAQTASAANLMRINNGPANTIQHYFSPSAPVAARQAQDAIDDSSGGKQPAIDEDSRQGRFGWDVVKKTNVPYIVRTGQEKFCAVRIIESKVLVHYLAVLRPEVYSCTSIQSHYMTEAEARVFNDINNKHCDSAYGTTLFTNQDLIVTVSDLREFYHFLDMCVNKLCNDRSQAGDRCGFVRINGESVVPYTLSDKNQFVPLFYFEGETETLKQKAEKLGGWDLSYLKFCCKVQGIRNELFSSDLCKVISLDDIRSYFPPGTVFEDYWPTKGVDKASLIDTTKNQLKMATRVGAWAKPPTEPPPPQIVPAATASAAAAPRVVANGWNIRAGAQQQLHQFQTPAVIQQPQVARANMFPIGNLVYSNTQSVQNGQQTTFYSQAHSLQTGAAPQPPPLVRTASSSAMTLTANLRPSPSYPGNGTRQTVTNVITSSSRSTAGGSLLLNQQPQNLLQQQPQNLLQQQQNPQTQSRYRVTPHASYQLQQVQLQRSQVPAPTVQRSTNMAPVAHRPLQQQLSNSSQLQISLRNQQQNAALQQQAANKQASSPPPLVPTNGISRASADAGLAQKLTQIEEVSIAPSTNHAPYKVQKALIDKTLTPCINAKPFNNSELMMTMSDLVAIFFPNTQLHNCRKLLQEVLRIELFKGNTLQMRALVEAGKASSINDVIPLVQVQDVIKFHKQISYVLGNKRPRVS